MSVPKIFESEYRFCLILWAHEPVASGELVRLCREELEWKPSTTYTVIRRLADRGVLKNENSVVISLVSRQEVETDQAEELVEKKFAGSLPAFVAAFTRSRNISNAEIDEVQRLIDAYRRGENHG